MCEKENNVNEEVINEEVVDEAVEFDFETLSQSEAIDLAKELNATNERLISENSALTEEIAKLKSESLSHKDSWYRTAAEFENYKKRNADTRKNAYFDGKKDTILNLLVIGDTIDRALSMDLDETTKNGLSLIARQFDETMTALGVEVINPINEVFNPETSEAIATAPCEAGEESDTVKTVYKKGYKIDSAIIRYCQVIVRK